MAGYQSTAPRDASQEETSTLTACTVFIDKAGRVLHICITMKTATVRDLRNHFPRVAQWIEEGEPVEITRSGKVFAHLVPVTRPARRRFKMPDIMARLEQTFGTRCYDAEDIAEGLAASRGDPS